ncbi:MAG: hypothetical protein HQK50_13560 [Oligoflexia bacterium]|nr:hypothetical protein [Oligoflexia bacterium]
MHLKKDTGRASNHVGIFSGIDNVGDYMEISAQIRGGRAMLMDKKERLAPIKNSKAGVSFGKNFRFYRRIKI